MSDLVGNPEDRFSHVAAQTKVDSSLYEMRHEKQILCFPNMSDTNQAVQAQKMARGLF